MKFTYKIQSQLKMLSYWQSLDFRMKGVFYNIIDTIFIIQNSVSEFFRSTVKQLSVTKFKTGATYIYICD